MTGPPYLGEIGRTRTSTVHVIDSRGALVAVQVYTAIDAVAEPLLAEQLRDDTLNVVQLGGGEMRIAVPVVYHDPAARLLVLVLGDAHRHREIEERIRLLEQLRDDIADIPSYAKDFVVVFGAEGLRALLAERVRQRDALAELAAARVELARLRGEARGHDTEQFAAEGFVPGLDDVPTGDSALDPDAEPVIERVVEAEDGSDEAVHNGADGAVAGAAGDAANGAAREAREGEAGEAGEPFDAFDGHAAFGAGAPGGAVVAAADPAGGPPHPGLGSGLDPELDPGFDEVPFDEPSLDEVPFDDPAFDDPAFDGVAFDEPVAAPRHGARVDEPLATPRYGARVDASGRGSTDSDAVAYTGRLGATDSDASAQAGGRGATDSDAGAHVGRRGATDSDAGADAGGRGATDSDAGAHAGRRGATDSDAGADADPEADADAEIAAALEAETGVDPDSALADEAADPGGVAALIDATESLGPGSDPVTTEVTDLPILGPVPGATADSEPIAPEPGWRVDEAGVHLAIAADAGLAAVLAGPLDLRLVLHRAPTAPVIALVIGSPAALRTPAPGELAVETLDITAEGDRAVLRALGRRFELTLTVVTGGRTVRRCKLDAPLADNVSYLTQAADEHVHAVTAHGALDLPAARERVLGAGHDLLGIGHPERNELRVDRLAQIATAQQLRRALAIARRFTRPALEDYLVCTRGFPLALWHQLRRKTVARAVAWGLWMGPELAQIAVSEGFARSRRDLIARLDRGFEKLRHDPQAFDIDAEFTADNAAAIAEQARALGVALRAPLPNGAGAIGSDAAPVAAGSIDTASSAGIPLPPDAALPLSTDELLEVLAAPAASRDARARRLAAALALCDHSDPRAARPVIAAALQMSRGEAVRVLARAVKLGPPAHPALIEGLSSSKAYLRHGCALALALGRSDEATQSVIGLLLSEPTDLWHDIARAVGEIGTPALVWLVRDVGRGGPEAAERIAWAMAHVGARGGDPALSAMAAAESIVSPIASRALELLAMLTDDRGAEPGAAGSAERDLSVNHAFSQQFFEALHPGAPDDVSGPMARVAAEL